MTFDAIENNPELAYLKQALLLLPNAKPCNTYSEFAILRCPLCGDSSHRESAHFYIGVKEYDGVLKPGYDCKFCSQSGMLNIDICHKIGLYDLRVEEYLKSLNIKKMIRTFSQDADTTSIQYKYPRATKEYQEKIDYFKKRTGIDLYDFENVKKYRIVLDFKKFLDMNNIKEPAASMNTIEMVTQEGIGFVSYDKTSISFRNLHPSEERGIPRFNIIHLYQNIKRPYFYMPPLSVDLLSPIPKIVVTESTFNAINIQNYFYKDNVDCVIASASRKGIKRLIKNLICLTGFVSGIIEIYADNDKTFSEEFFAEQLDEFAVIYDTRIILRTDEGEKDFGSLPTAEDGFYHFNTIRV